MEKAMDERPPIVCFNAPEGAHTWPGPRDRPASLGSGAGPPAGLLLWADARAETDSAVLDLFDLCCGLPTLPPRLVIDDGARPDADSPLDELLALPGTILVRADAYLRDPAAALGHLLREPARPAVALASAPRTLAHLWRGAIRAARHDLANDLRRLRELLRGAPPPDAAAYVARHGAFLLGRLAARRSALAERGRRYRADAGRIDAAVAGAERTLRRAMAGPSPDALSALAEATVALFLSLEPDAAGVLNDPAPRPVPRRRGARAPP
jgi:hypothetical protein